MGHKNEAKPCQGEGLAKKDSSEKGLASAGPDRATKPELDGFGDIMQLPHPGFLLKAMFPIEGMA
jgi:hypothetical protein